MTQSITPMVVICNAAARACWSGGASELTSAPDPAQSAQTRIEPMTAPGLLPEPPTISMTQTWKVSIGV